MEAYLSALSSLASSSVAMHGQYNGRNKYCEMRNGHLPRQHKIDLFVVDHGFMAATAYRFALLLFIYVFCFMFPCIFCCSSVMFMDRCVIIALDEEEEAQP